MIDEIDLKILKIIQNDAKASNANIAKEVGMAPSAVFERIKKLESKGVIKDYISKIDPNILDLGLLAFIFIKTDEKLGATATPELLKAIPEIQEIHDIAGEDCYLVKVRVKNTEALSHLLREKLASISTVKSTKTTVVLQTIKETSSLPIGDEV